jgi:OOP family OmpA-OmpF porin
MPLEKNVNVSRLLGVLGAVACAATAGGSAVADDAGWYVGANVGQARAKIDERRITDNLSAAGFSTTAFKSDDTHFGYKLFGGYQFVKYFALEAGYFDLGRFGFTANTSPPAGLTGTTRLRGGDLDAVGIIPFTDKFAAFGRIGYAYTDANDRFASYGAVVIRDSQRKQNSSNYKFGFGLQYALSDSWGMRAEAERYRVGDAVGNKGDVDLFSVGLLYRFGATSHAPPPIARSVAPAPIVEAAPEPPPPPPPPPAPPVRKRVSFSADSLFDFGKDTVRPAGKLALDHFAAELKGSQFDVINVTGHTDRIGSHDYNMRLSMRRAESVKAYLVQSAGIPENKVSARGADGEDPVTKPDDCPGQQRTPKLIACLQPDRRVDVEVVGTRLQPAPMP